jgi:hypothetical protein
VIEFIAESDLLVAKVKPEMVHQSRDSKEIRRRWIFGAVGEAVSRKISIVSPEFRPEFRPGTL